MRGNIKSMSGDMKEYYDEFSITRSLRGKALIKAIRTERCVWVFVGKENPCDEDVKHIVAQKLEKLDKFKKKAVSELPTIRSTLRGIDWWFLPILSYFFAGIIYGTFLFIRKDGILDWPFALIGLGIIILIMVLSLKKEFYKDLSIGYHFLYAILTFFGGLWVISFFSYQGVINNKQSTYEGSIAAVFKSPREGKMVYSNGRSFVGRWVMGTMYNGTMSYPDGSWYYGTWVNDTEKNQGKMFYSDGTCYDGKWQNGKKHGRGKMILQNGQMYEGKWKNDKKHGRGKIVSKDGTIFKEGIWKDDKFVKE